MQDSSESALVEEPAIALFGAWGYEAANVFYEKLGKNGTFVRETYGEVVLLPRLRAALQRLNPGLAREAIEIAIEELTRDRSALSLANANREVYRLLKNGVNIRIRGEGDEEVDETVRVIDWTNPPNNECFLVYRLWIMGEMHTRRADLAGLVNGLPFIFIELKAAHKRLENTYHDNLPHYKDTHPQI